MKKVLIFCAAVLGFSLTAGAQCPVKVVYTVSKMEILDSTMTTVDTKDMSAKFEVLETGIHIHPDQDETHDLTGTINKATCNWADPNKNGTMVIMSDIHDEHEDLKNAQITFTAVDGKITIVLKAVEYPNKIIKLQIDKYEEKK